LNPGKLVQRAAEHSAESGLSVAGLKTTTHSFEEKIVQGGAPTKEGARGNRPAVNIKQGQGTRMEEVLRVRIASLPLTYAKMILQRLRRYLLPIAARNA